MQVILAGFYYPHHTISPHYKGIFAVCPAPSLNSALSVHSCPSTVHMTCGSRHSYRAALHMNSVISLVLCALYIRVLPVVCCDCESVPSVLYSFMCVCVHVVVCSVCTCMCNCVHLCVYVICVCVYICVYVVVCIIIFYCMYVCMCVNEFVHVFA